MDKSAIASVFEGIILDYAKNSPDFFFVEIGANDGIERDPIYNFAKKYKWKGILVEPQKKVFKKLKQNYKNINGLAFENAAIARKSGTAKLFLPKFTTENSTLVPSLIKEILAKEWKESQEYKKAPAKADMDDYIIAKKVDCITFDCLLKKHNVKKIDLLLIDTEGYDFEIIKSIDFSAVKPQIIRYEHKHLSEKDKKACIRLLESKKYTIASEDSEDTVAVLDKKLAEKAKNLANPGWLAKAQAVIKKVCTSFFHAIGRGKKTD